MKIPLYVGIDPGKSGAVVAIEQNRSIRVIEDTPVIEVKKGKKHQHQYLESQMLQVLRRLPVSGLVRDYEVKMVYIERAQAMPGQGGTSMFSIGYGFGLWIMALTALEIPHTRIEPARWKKELGFPTGADKGASIVRALQLFPKAAEFLRRKKDDGRADALLLAEFARRQNSNS